MLTTQLALCCLLSLHNLSIVMALSKLSMRIMVQSVQMLKKRQVPLLATSISTTAPTTLSVWLETQLVDAALKS